MEQEIEIDCLGKDEDKATWIFCGAFPLVEIAKGRRACRQGWRNRIADANKERNLWGLEVPPKDRMYFDMLSVSKYDGPNGPELIMERESEKYFEDGGGDFNYVNDMLAEDWFLEKSEEALPENPAAPPS